MLAPPIAESIQLRKLISGIKKIQPGTLQFWLSWREDYQCVSVGSQSRKDQVEPRRFDGEFAKLVGGGRVSI